MAPYLFGDEDSGYLVQDSSRSSMEDSSLDDEESPVDRTEPIAIVGLALKFPQEATSAEAFWNMIVTKRCAMTEFPPSRLNVDAFYDPDVSKGNTLPLRGGHFIKEDLGAFDAGFFSITPTEAAAMDPAQRLLLETAYQGFENAGIPVERASGTNTSVHTGCFTDDYKLQILSDTEQIPKYAATGLSLAMLANRLSWFFNLSGPSVNMDSACSSSGIALDHACSLLRTGDCDMSLVAGCNLTYVSDYTSILTKMSFLSPDSRCYTFDHRANGYARGEGIGVVLLKRLSDAIRDRNTIRAIIRSSGSNQDARTPGITQPSSKAQERLIRETYRKAGLSMKYTRFIEAHGTGTQMGDKTETNALGAAFRDYRGPEDPLYVGAVKTNIGHLEGASGIAGLIKAILVLETGMIVPNTNFEQLNRKIDAEHLSLVLPSECIPWPTNGLRRVSVNSFGFGGSNAHIILDDAFNYLHIRKLAGIHCTAHRPPHPLDSEANSIRLWSQHYFSSPTASQNGSERTLKTPNLLVFSASDREGTDRIAKQYQEHLSRVLEEDIDHGAYARNLIYTLDSCRSILPWRSYIVLESLSDLKDLVARISTPVFARVSSPRLGYVFTGQGAQWYAMGRELLRYPVFAESIENADVILNRLGCAWLAKDELAKDKATSNIDDPTYSQPLCTVVQLALVDLMMSVGIRPVAVMGHSSGEIAAAYCAGAISQQSACKIAYYRGYVAALLTTNPSEKGAMMSVGLSAQNITPFLSTVKKQAAPFDTDICCFNGPQNVTVSGPEAQIDLLKTMFDRQGVFARKLQVAVAYHSPQMEQVAPKYLSLMGELSTDGKYGPVPMVSTVTGAQVKSKELRTSQYWVQNMVLPVRFTEAMQLLCANNKRNLTKKIDGSHRDDIFVDHLVEIGPHGALQSPIRECLKHFRGDNNGIGYNTVLRRGTSASKTFLDMVGQLHALGYQVDLRRVNNPAPEYTETCMALIDLPGYPFDHSMSYWHESRISSGHRLRKHGHVELLGSPASDWNPLDAQWRNVITTGDIPWANDHKINGAVLCPGAGMIVMALEAALQTADPDRHIMGFRLRKITFEVALDLSSDLETRFSLRASKNHYHVDEPWSHFTIFSLRGGRWTEHCTGAIQIQYSPQGSSNAEEPLHSWRHYQPAWDSIQESCSSPGDSHHMYQYLQDCGIEYGPDFRKIVRFQYSDDGHTVAEIESLKGGREDLHPPNLIHPATLDAIMHSVFFAQSRGGSQEIGTQVPTSIESMWLSREGLGEVTDKSMSIMTKIEASTPRNVTSSSLAVNREKDRVFATINGLEMSTVAEATSRNINDTSGYGQIWCTMKSVIDPDALTPSQTVKWLDESFGTVPPEPVAFYKDVQNLLDAVLSTELRKVILKSGDPRPAHLQRYIEWMSWQLDNRQLKNKESSSSELNEEIDVRVREQGAVGRTFSEVSRNLEGILQGIVDPLQLLFDDGLVEGYYKGVSESSMSFPKLQKYLHALSSKRPEMRIMEVGAGTGVFTSMVLEALSVRGANGIQARMFDHYHFTDISPSFFEGARSMLSDFGQKLSFGILDIENDFNPGGHEGGLYDMIVAANVIHISKDLRVPLRNLHRALKPGGMLIIHETTTPRDPKTGFIFGLLQDWWLAKEPYRRMSPLVTETDWDLLLKETGFSGTDLVLRDFEDDTCHQSSIMISTARGSQKSSSIMPPTSIIIDPESPLQQCVAQSLQERLCTDYELSVNIQSLKESSSTDRPKESVYISLVEIEKPVLQGLDPKTFLEFRSFMSSVNRVIWTTGGGGSGHAAPGFGMVDGFARALRLERNDLDFVTLALDPAVGDVEDKVNQIVQVAAQAFMHQSDTKHESEYIQRSGMLYVNRIVPADALKMDAVERLAGKRTRLQNLEQQTSFEIKFPELGGPAEIEFVECDLGEELGPPEVEIKVEAIGLNTADMLGAWSSTNKSGLGIECAGTITRLGTDSANTLNIGDRVCMLGSYLSRSHAMSKHDLVARIPDHLSFEQAAILPYHAWLASYLIERVARLGDDDSLLLLDGMSTLGQSVTAMARKTGAAVLATVGSDEDRSVLKDRFGLQERCILPSKGFSDQLRHTGHARAIDVIISHSGDEDLSDALECLSPGGRLIHVKRLSGQCPEGPSLSELGSNVTFTAVDPLSLLKTDTISLHKPLQVIIDQTPIEVDNLPNVTSFDVSHVAEAITHLKEMDRQARAVLCMNLDNVIPLTRPLQPEYQFDQNASYVIAGGLGGLGRCVARWMVTRGARNLILPSRSGPRTSAAQAMIKDMTANGIRVEAPACNAADLTALQSTMSECMKSMPPVKGCIQASGAIQDIWFDKMSFDDWTATVRPKVDASWNLHTVLPAGMDFFILTASISGIFGQITQVNYAAGNTYQDALAKYRIAHGEKAVSLDLGLLAIDGLLADKPEVVERLNKTGYFIPLSEAEVIAIFDRYCNPNLVLSSPEEAQPIIGIQSPAALKMKGIELPTSMQQPLWYQMVCTGTDETSVALSKEQSVDLSTLVAGAESIAAGGDIATEALMSRVGQILTMPVEKFDANRPPHVYGVDSLTAVEIRNWVSKTFAVEASLFEVLGDSSFTDLGLSIARKCIDGRK